MGEVAFGHRAHDLDHFGNAAQIAARALHGVVDEGLLARQLRQRCIEVAAAEFGHHAHRQFLDRDMRAHHLVDAQRHAAEVAIEAAAVDDHVDIAGFMFGRHVVDLGDQAGEVAAHLFDGVVDEALLARQQRQLCGEVAAAEFADAGDGLLLDRDMAGHHRVDALGHATEIAGEALGVDDHVDIAGIVLGRHAVDLGDHAGEVAADLVDDLVDEGLLARQPFQFGGKIAATELGHARHRLFFHRDMAGHHAVDAIAHGAEIAIEARHIDARIDLAGIVFARNAVDFLVDVADAALHLAQPAQDIAGLVVAPLRQRHVEVAARERVQRGGGHLQRRAGDTDCPDQQGAADQCCNDTGAQ